MKKAIKINFRGCLDLPNEELLAYKLLEEKYDIQIVDDPDYIFFGVYSNYDYCNFKGIRIFYPFELFLPDMNVVDYATTYSGCSCGDRIFTMFSPLQSDYIKELQDRPKYDKEFLKSKTGFCNYIYSHMGIPERKEIFDAISKYKKVDSAGRYLNNMDGFTPGSRASVCPTHSNTPKIDFQRKYKFTIACENGVYNNYNTEKLTDAFYAGTIPIYFGDPLVGEVFNEKAFINCNKYKSFDEVVEVIKKIDSDDELYLQMLNEPVFNNPHFVDDEIEKFRKFLYNIFDQPYEKAFRRPDFAYPLYHEFRMREITEIYRGVGGETFSKYNSFKEILAFTRRLKRERRKKERKRWIGIYKYRIKKIFRIIFRKEKYDFRSRRKEK